MRLQKVTLFEWFRNFVWDSLFGLAALRYLREFPMLMKYVSPDKVVHIHSHVAPLYRTCRCMSTRCLVSGRCMQQSLHTRFFTRIMLCRNFSVYTLTYSKITGIIVVCTSKAQDMRPCTQVSVTAKSEPLQFYSLAIIRSRQPHTETTAHREILPASTHGSWQRTRTRARDNRQAHPPCERATQCCLFAHSNNHQQIVQPIQRYHAGNMPVLPAPATANLMSWTCAETSSMSKRNQELKERVDHAGGIHAGLTCWRRRPQILCPLRKRKPARSCCCCG